MCVEMARFLPAVCAQGCLLLSSDTVYDRYFFDHSCPLPQPPPARFVRDLAAPHLGYYRAYLLITHAPFSPSSPTNPGLCEQAESHAFSGESSTSVQGLVDESRPGQSGGVKLG